MRQQTLRMAVCSMTAALGVVVMLLGAVLGLGTYLSPLLVGLCLIPVGKEYGTKYQLVVWAAVSLLCLMLVSDVEQNLMFIGLFGWYPVLRPRLQKLTRVLRFLIKLVLFNVIVAAIETLLLLVLVPEDMGTVFAIVLLALGNVTFFLYDTAIPYFELIVSRYLRKFFPKH